MVQSLAQPFWVLLSTPPHALHNSPSKWQCDSARGEPGFAPRLCVVKSRRLFPSARRIRARSLCAIRSVRVTRTRRSLAPDDARSAAPSIVFLAMMTRTQARAYVFNHRLCCDGCRAVWQSSSAAHRLRFMHCISVSSSYCIFILCALGCTARTSRVYCTATTASRC